MSKTREKLLKSENHVETIYDRDGDEHYIRNGTRGQRNAIEKAMTSKGGGQMDGPIVCLYYRLADEEGNQLFADMSKKEFASVLDYNLVVELAMKVRELDGIKLHDEDKSNPLADNDDGPEPPETYESRVQGMGNG